MSICNGPADRTLIFCHLCKLNFPSHEELKMHIMKKHRPSSKFYEGDSDDSELVNFAENCERSQRPPKRKLEQQYDEDNSLDYEDFDDQNSYNISETAVSPQSSHHRCKNKKNSPTAKFNPSKVKQEFVEAGNSFAHFSAPGVMDFNSISSSANQIAPQMICYGNNQINPQLNPMFNNNQLQLINPYNQPSNYLMGNQPALQFNPVISSLRSQKAFDFNAKNIIKWYNKFKKMSKSLKYPLQQKVLKKMKRVQLDLYHNCSFPRVFAEKEKAALLKIYQDLGLIMVKNFEVAHDIL